MYRVLWNAGVIAGLALPITIVVAALIAADKPKEDGPEVLAARKKLEQKVTVDFKDEPFQKAMDEIGKQIDLKFYRDVGISGNKALTYGAKDKPAKEVLHELLKEHGLGYVIHRKKDPNDRYAGWIQIVSGDARGDEPTAAKDPTKPETKPMPPKDPPKPDPGDADEKAAASKLKLAKAYLEDGQIADARECCEQIIKKYSMTKAAAEAKELLEKLKKK